jgi:hypothetical protein
VEQQCDQEDAVLATALCPDGRRSVTGVGFGNGAGAQSFGLRVGLRIRCAVRARGSECREGREAVERRVHLANAEEATAAVMRYGYQ